MNYNMKYEKRALKSIKKLNQNVKERLEKEIEQLIQKPQDGKKLSGDLKNFLSWRFGDFRIIYTINNTDKEVIIRFVGHRSTVYEIMNRLLSFLLSF